MGVAERSEYDRGCGNSFAAAFSRALLDPEGETPSLVAGPYGKGTLKRYNVYRNNVTVSLISALASIYPAVQRITCMEFFRAMARFYIRANPPTSPLLFEYGRDFPDFIDRYEYARSMPWLSDAARLERAWLDAYHAADMAPLALQTLAAIPTDRLGETLFVLHPAARIVRSEFAAVSIFTANRSDKPVGIVDASEPEDGLVTRPEQEVVVRRLPAGGAEFLTSLIAGETLVKAASAAFEASDLFDLAVNIAGMVEAGVFTAVQFGG